MVHYESVFSKDWQVFLFPPKRLYQTRLTDILVSVSAVGIARIGENGEGERGEKNRVNQGKPTEAEQQVRPSSRAGRVGCDLITRNNLRSPHRFILYMYSYHHKYYHVSYLQHFPRRILNVYPLKFTSPPAHQTLVLFCNTI